MQEAKKPKVDVILSVYNPKQWVYEAIDSVLAQSYTNWKLTIVDDGSPKDICDQIISKYKSFSDKIQIIRLKMNRRAAGARMEAINATDGEVITFIDQDDRWHHRKLEEQMLVFRKDPMTGAVHSDVNHIDRNGILLRASAVKENKKRSLIKWDILTPEQLSMSLFNYNSIRLGSSAVLRTCFLNSGGFNSRLFGGEDWEFWVRFSAKYRIRHLSQPLLERRIHDRNTSGYLRYERSYGLLKATDILLNKLPHLYPLEIGVKIRILKRMIIAGIESEKERDSLKIQMRELLKISPFQIFFISSCYLLQINPLKSELIKFLRKINNAFQ